MQSFHGDLHSFPENLLLVFLGGRDELSIDHLLFTGLMMHEYKSPPVIPCASFAATPTSLAQKFLQERNLMIKVFQLSERCCSCKRT